MLRAPSLAVALSLLLPAAAGAAIQTGAYAGTSTGKYQEYGKLDMSTDKGKVTFKVATPRTVKKLRISGQTIQCGAGGQEVAIQVAKIKLNADGKGKATYTDPAVGDFKVLLSVGDNGRAKGKAVPQGLCSETISLTARRK